jgi:hypothetical protein
LRREARAFARSASGDGVDASRGSALTVDTDHGAAPGGDALYLPASRPPTVAVIDFPDNGFDGDNWHAYRRVFATLVVED